MYVCTYTHADVPRDCAHSLFSVLLVLFVDRGCSLLPLPLRPQCAHIFQPWRIAGEFTRANLCHLPLLYSPPLHVLSASSEYTRSLVWKVAAGSISKVSLQNKRHRPPHMRVIRSLVYFPRFGEDAEARRKVRITIEKRTCGRWPERVLGVRVSCSRGLPTGS